MFGDDVEPYDSKSVRGAGDGVRRASNSRSQREDPRKGPITGDPLVLTPAPESGESHATVANRARAAAW